MYPASAKQRQIIALAKATHAKRTPLLTFWQELALNFYPERASFTTTLALGEDFAAHLMESFPVLMRRELGNTFSSYLRPRGQEWFEVMPTRESMRSRPDVRRASQHMGAIMRTRMYKPRAHFVKATKECDHDFATFGNGVISCQERMDRSGLLYQNWHLRNCSWLENDEGDIDRFFRDYKLPLRDAMRRYGDAMHDNWKNAAQDAAKGSMDVPVMHIVVPWADIGEKINGKKPRRDREETAFVSMVIDLNHECVLHQKIIGWMPYVVPRWATISDSQYAFSPAATIGLPDARLIQRQALAMLEAGEKAVDPPLVATREAVQGEVNLVAGGITWVDAEYDERLGQALRPLDMGKNPMLAVDMKKDTRELLLQAFFINKLALPDTRDMTAYEARLRTQEYIRAAMPIFESIEAGYNAALLDLSFTILSETGAFQEVEIPDDFRGDDVEFSFENPLQETYRRQRAQMFSDGMAGPVAIAAQADPNAIKVVRVIPAMRDALEASGWPEEWMADADQAEDVEGGAQLEAGLSDLMGQVTQGAGMVQGLAGAAQAVQQAVGPTPEPGRQAAQ